jgi:hypothetical protein
MIVTELISGLGNQMFQYAAGLSLAKRLDSELYIDKTWFDLDIEKQTVREYGLSPFNLKPNFASPEIIEKFKPKNGNGLVHRIQGKMDSLKPYFKRKIYKEPFFHYDENFEQAIDNTYLIGYWQSEKYFLNIESDVRQAFSLREEATGLNAELKHKIQHSMSVSLHVRRTDMVNNPDVIKTHGACTLEYYHAAAEHILPGLTDPEFFVFSDDPEWCKANLELPVPVTFISHNIGEKAHWDMFLMSCCRHHVIANSSFSWWGAWLNPSEDKRVIAPKQWFATNERDTKDIIPSSWSRL